mgnify:CR=1 FL=1
MRNGLSGHVTLSTIECLLDTHIRGREIQLALQRLSQGGSAIFDGAPLNPLFMERRANLPQASQDDRRSYELANHAAAVCLNALQDAGYSRGSAEASWVVKHPREGHWSLTLPSLFSINRALPYLINLQVGPEGVWEIAYSRGQRGPLGGLFGRRIFSGPTTEAFSDAEITRVLTVLCSEEGRQDPMREFRELSTIRQGVSVLAMAPLREVDPEAIHRDTIARFWSGLKSLIPFPRYPGATYDY